MYPNPIPLNDGAATINYDYRGSTTDGSVYRNSSAPMDKPQQLKVQHSTTKPGTMSQVRNTRVGLSTVLEDASGNQGTLIVDLVVRIPEKVATVDDVTKEVTKLTDFLATAGFIAKVVAGEI